MWPGAEMSERFSLVDTSSKTPISQRLFVKELKNQKIKNTDQSKIVCDRIGNRSPDIIGTTAL